MIGSQVGIGGQVTVGGQVGQVGAKAVKNNSHEVIMLITYGLSKYLYQV